MKYFHIKQKMFILYDSINKADLDQEFLEPFMQVKFREFFFLSNLLSISRIILVIPMAFLIAANTKTGNIILLILAFIAGGTDILDGYVSRQRHQVTELGIILDPICDKIAMAVIFISLILYRQFPLPLLVFFLYRDLLIIISGSALLRVTKKPMMANIWGKINTLIFGLIGLDFLIKIQNPFSNILIGLGYLSLLLSSISYAITGLSLITKNNLIRLSVWIAITIPAILLYYFMSDLSFFLK